MLRGWLQASSAHQLGEVQEEAPALIRVIRGGEQMWSGMDDGLAAAFDSNTQLKGGEWRDSRTAGGGGQTLGSEPAQDFSYGNGAVTAALLGRGKEGGPTEVGEDRREKKEKIL